MSGPLVPLGLVTVTGADPALPVGATTVSRVAQLPVNEVAAFEPNRTAVVSTGWSQSA